MNTLILAAVGLLAGVVFGIWLFRRMLNFTPTRIFLADWANWNQTELPSGCRQLIRHGKWVAEIREDAE